jgi:CTD small phosphatase-like protein 2
MRNTTSRTVFSNGKSTDTTRKSPVDNKNSIAPTKAVLFSPTLTHAAKLEQQQQQVDTTPTKQDDDVDDDEDVFNPYQFIATLSQYTSEDRKVWLPPLSPSAKIQTLTLDLDETLVHCSIEPVAKYDWSFPVSFNGTDYQVYVKKRPYLDYFLEIVSKSFEVIVFTASQKVYADVLLDLLDPEKKFIRHRLFREACVPVQGNYIKDLQVLGRDLNKTVLVDNSPHAYGFQIDNGIPIESWFDDDNDTELLKLVGFLRQLVNVDDVDRKSTRLNSSH